MKSVVILDAVRTPFGKYKGQFANISSVDLGVIALSALMKRNSKFVSTTDVDQIIFGSVLQGGNGQNIARQIGVKAGLPVEVPAFTINEVCGSGLKAALLAKQAIALGEAEFIIAGGTENMSQAQTMQRDGLADAFEDVPMGLTVERLATEFDISREMQDAFALRSHQNAAKADFRSEIIPVNGNTTLESIRSDTSLEKLSTLKSAFSENGSITPGNASSVNDGASAILLCSQSYADMQHIPYIAIIRESVEIGIEPSRMGVSPVKAIHQLLEKSGLTLEQIDRFEINESFAASSLIIERELNLDASKVNVKGGAIALGHPLGATGARLITTLSHQLCEEHLHYGIASLCIGGGLGLAVLIENPAAIPTNRKFYQLTRAERLSQLALPTNNRKELDNNALSENIANNLIENQIGEIELPLGLAFINVEGKRYSVPMATEEPSVIAAANNGAKIAEDFHIIKNNRLMNGQIVFYDVINSDILASTIDIRKKEIFEIAKTAYPSIIERGGGLRTINCGRIDTDGFYCIDFYFDTCDALGANIINTILEAIANNFRIWFPTEKILFSILSNNNYFCETCVDCHIPIEKIGREVAEKIVLASDYAQLDKTRAATHNKGIMNGIEAILLALGNDTRAVNAAIYSYAENKGLTTWHIEKNILIGEISLPLPIATAGGATQILPKAKVSHSLMDNPDSFKLMGIVASIGLAQNLAALKALVTDGIQAGHMTLQARSLALSVDAKSDEIEQLVTALKKAPAMNTKTAKALLEKLRKSF